jgi:hypothetical protein
MVIKSQALDRSLPTQPKADTTESGLSVAPKICASGIMIQGAFRYEHIFAFDRNNFFYGHA